MLLDHLQSLSDALLQLIKFHKIETNYTIFKYIMKATRTNFILTINDHIRIVDVSATKKKFGDESSTIVGTYDRKRSYPLFERFSRSSTIRR